MSSLHGITETVGISKRFSPLNIKQSPIKKEKMERHKTGWRGGQNIKEEKMESRSRKRGKGEEDGEEENIEKRRS